MPSIFTTLPLPGVSITQELIDQCIHLKLIAPGVLAFHALDGFAAKGKGYLETIPTSASKPKRWATFGASSTYLTVEGSLDTSNSATWSDFTMTVVGQRIAGFWQERAIAKDPVFARIPKLTTFTTNEPAAMNMVPDIGCVPGPRVVTSSEVPYPLALLGDDPTGHEGKRWSWNTELGLRFNPTTGAVEAFNYQEYNREFPLTYNVSVGGGNGGTIRVRAGMNDEAFLAATAGALFGSGSPAERVAAILKNLEVK